MPIFEVEHPNGQKFEMDAPSIEATDLPAWRNALEKA